MKIPTQGLLEELEQLDIELSERQQDGYGPARTLAMRNGITARRLLKAAVVERRLEYHDYELLELRVTELIMRQGKYCTDQPQEMINHYHAVLADAAETDVELQGLLMDAAIRVRELMWEDLKKLGDDVLALVALLLQAVAETRSKDISGLVKIFFEQLDMLLVGFKTDLVCAYESFQVPVRDGIALREMLTAARSDHL